MKNPVEPAAFACPGKLRQSDPLVCHPERSRNDSLRESFCGVEGSLACRHCPAMQGFSPSPLCRVHRLAGTGGRTRRERLAWPDIAPRGMGSFASLRMTINLS